MKKDAKKTLIKLVVAVPLMFAFGFALVPLYDVFCEVTGINGKVFQSEYSEDLIRMMEELSLFSLYLLITKTCLGLLNLQSK